MERQPSHAAAQVTLLEESFVFLPCRMQVPLAWGKNSSSEQHSWAQAPNAAASCCTQGEQQRAQQGKQQRAQKGKHQQRAASSERQDKCVAWHCREGGATIHHDSI